MADAEDQCSGDYHHAEQAQFAHILVNGRCEADCEGPQQGDDNHQQRQQSEGLRVVNLWIDQAQGLELI